MKQGKEIQKMVVGGEVCINYPTYDFWGNAFLLKKRLIVFHPTVDQTSRACNSIYMSFFRGYVQYRFGATLSTSHVNFAGNLGKKKKIYQQLVYYRIES